MGLILFCVLITIVATVASGVLLQKWAPGLAAGLVVSILTILIGSFTVVGPGERGVQVTFGDVNMTALESGVHFVNPLSKVIEINVQLQRATLEKSSASTKDLQQVHTDINANFRLSDTKVAYIYKDYGVDVVDKVLSPSLNEAFKSVTAKYNSEELVTKREEVSAMILDHEIGRAHV